MASILYIEDTDSLARTLTDHFMMSGHDVSHVKSLSSAFDVLSDTKIDTVLSDYDLSLYDVHTGTEIVTALHDEYPDLRYAIYSGLEREDVPSWCRFFLKSDLVELLDWVDGDG